MIEEMNSTDAENLVRRCSFGHLACVLENGEPYLVPINYLFEGGDVFVHTLPGKKLDALRTHGKVCLQVEEIKDDCRWRSAIVFGEFEEIKQTSRKLRILQKFSENFSRLTPVEAIGEDNITVGGIVIFRIDIRKITGVAEN